MPPVIDFQMGYALATDLVVFRRNTSTVQIGTEPPRQVLIVDAPENAEDVLIHLRETPTLAEAVARLGGDGTEWRRLFENLLRDGLLQPRATTDRYPPRLAGERATLTHRWGPAGADRTLATRADAVLSVEGSGAIADAISDLLDAAGIGIIHQIPGGTVLHPISPPSDPSAAVRHPRVRYRRIAPQVRPNLALLIDAPSPGRITDLTITVTPHLPVQVTTSRVVVGPLVLPGITACLNCVDRHRLDADPEWRTVVTAAAATPVQPGPVLARWAAILAVSQALTFVDGLERPESVGATLEVIAGATGPRRRPWPPHRQCRCRELVAASV